MTTGAPPAASSPKQSRAQTVHVDHRLPTVRLRERFYDSFWLLPASFLVGALVLAFITREIDSNLSPTTAKTIFYIVNARDAGIVLSTLATAMLTFLGVVFSIGLVALQLASQQFSPRVVRNYVRSTTIKLALGTFIATFIYPLFSLGYLQELTHGGRSVATISEAIAMVLAIASIAVFVAYVTLTIRGMRIAYAISTVAIETGKALQNVFPADEGYTTVEALSFGEPALTVTYETRRFSLATHVDQGVLQAVDVVTCVRVAREHDCVIRMIPQVGQFVGRGEPLFELHGGGGGAPVATELLRTVDIGPERAVYQDPFFGVRALVDVAAQALSPAVNAPTTAVQVLDRLQDFLRQLACRPWPTGLFADETGTVRFVAPVRTWDQFVDLALTEITEFGAGSPQVTRRLADLITSLIPVVPPERQPVLLRHKQLLWEAVNLRVSAYRALAEMALEPDVRGLG